ncbi:AAA family ATPase [uncultured Reyranella sp.]|uniref:ATP-dependent nuclease n=1 Tax=uncultured Reyranella sp. TaxID=735512 RepID=UPI00259D0A65|nr:AAA family ATPase [uncultured Reyranella sp.]
MRIESIRIKNLRSFADVTVPLNKYACLVGPNGAGKSTVLCALNVFFRETNDVSTNLIQLSAEDFHQRNTKEPIEITVTFTDLSPEAQNDFAEYYRQGKLIVSAIARFDEGTGKAEVKQTGQRLVMSAFKEFFEALGDRRPVSELKQHFGGIREKVPLVAAASTKDAMIEALRTYEAQHPEECELIPSEDHFYGATKGAHRLGKYIQWVYVPAVKDASTEQVEARNTGLGKLLARTVRSKTNFGEGIQSLKAAAQSAYQTLLDASQSALDGISTSLGARLAQWAHPEATVKVQWSQNPETSIRVDEPFARIIAGEGSFEGELARFGHGLQRSYLLALLQELASIEDAAAPMLILGCEEPELYQHPPQARHLASVLKSLSEGNAQVIVTTHSPMFVAGDGFEDVRIVRRNLSERCSEVAYMSYADLASKIAETTGGPPKSAAGILAKIHQALQPALGEMFFTRRLILVEGLEDVAYITACLNLMGKWEDYRRLGCHIVPVNGKSEMLQPLIIAKKVGIPTYVVIDSDADKPDKAGSRVKHEKDNRELLGILGKPEANALPEDTIWGTGFVMWKSDIGRVVEDDVGAAAWTEAQNKADELYGLIGNLKKNTLHIGAKLAHTWALGKTSPQLERLCNEILNPQMSV